MYLLGNSTMISEEATGTFDNFRRSKVKFDLYIRLHIVFCRVIRNILNKLLYFFLFSRAKLKTCKKITDWVCLFTSNLQKNGWSKINYFLRKYLQLLTVSEKFWLFWGYFWKVLLLSKLSTVRPVLLVG